jgi:hypothetical protein
MLMKKITLLMSVTLLLLSGCSTPQTVNTEQTQDVVPPQSQIAPKDSSVTPEPVVEKIPTPDPVVEPVVEKAPDPVVEPIGENKPVPAAISSSPKQAFVDFYSAIRSGDIEAANGGIYGASAETRSRLEPVLPQLQEALVSGAIKIRFCGIWKQKDDWALVAIYQNYPDGSEGTSDHYARKDNGKWMLVPEGISPRSTHDDISKGLNATWRADLSSIDAKYPDAASCTTSL